MNLSSQTTGTLSIGSGGTGQTTNTTAFDALAPAGPAKGTVLIYNGTHWVNHGVGSDGSSLAADSTQSDGVNWASGAYAVTQTVSASNIDWSAATIFHKFLNAPITFTFSNVKPGTIFINVTNTAGNYTVSWPTSASGIPVGWPNGTVPTQTTGVHTDAYTFVNDGITIVGTAVQSY